MAALLSVRDLAVTFRVSGVDVPAVRGISFALAAGWSCTDDGTLPTTIPTFTFTLSGSTGTIDLTAVGTPTLNMTGLGLVSATFKATSTNTHVITVATGATTGYTPIGAIDVSLSGGDIITINYPSGDSNPVGAGTKLLDVAGTSGESVSVTLSFIAS